MSGEPHLRQGDNDPWVQWAQTALETAGFPVGRPPDEEFDGPMHHQVVAFQEHHGIFPANGELNEQTWAALDPQATTHQDDDVIHATRTGANIANLESLVIQIAQRRLEFWFQEVSRAVATFRSDALQQQDLVGTEPEADVSVIFEAATAVFAFAFPEAELTALVAELAVKGFKDHVEHAKQASVSADKRDIVSLSQRLVEAAEAGAAYALYVGEKALQGDSHPAHAALMKLEQLPEADQQEWLEYAVTQYLGIPDAVAQSPYLYVLEPMEAELAAVVERQKFRRENGTPATPFWREAEAASVHEARVGVEVDYERREREASEHHPPR